MNLKQLRQFNPATANIGDTVVTNTLHRATYRGVTADLSVCLIEYTDLTYTCVLKDNLYQPPLCYVEDKPVYRGDVLYSTLYGSKGEQRTVTGMSSKSIIASVEIGEHSSDINNLTWTKPKVMVTKTGWINIYPSHRPMYKTETGLVIYQSKDDAKFNAGKECLTCIPITWQQEE